MVNPLTGGYWVATHDADPCVVTLYERHYSADPAKNGHHRSGISGPSERMVLLATDGRALWVWRLMLPPTERISKLAQPDKRRARKGLAVGEDTSSYFGEQYGVMCSVFRNESEILSSTLIREAVELAWGRWPGQRLFTYVWDNRVRSPNPGYCYKVAGFRFCGRTKDSRLSILELLPPTARLPGTG